MDKYYRVYDGSDYLYTGYNSESKLELTEDLRSYLEPEFEGRDLKSLMVMSADDICDLKGWQIEESETPFEELEELDYE